jgi:hypothetical protein
MRMATVCMKKDRIEIIDEGVRSEEEAVGLFIESAMARQDSAIRIT